MLPEAEPRRWDAEGRWLRCSLGAACESRTSGKACRRACCKSMAARAAVVEDGGEERIRGGTVVSGTEPIKMAQVQRVAGRACTGHSGEPILIDTLRYGWRVPRMGQDRGLAVSIRAQGQKETGRQTDYCRQRTAETSSKVCKILEHE